MYFTFQCQLYQLLEKSIGSLETIALNYKSRCAYARSAFPCKYFLTPNLVTLYKALIRWGLHLPLTLLCVTQFRTELFLWQMTLTSQTLSTLVYYRRTVTNLSLLYRYFLSIKLQLDRPIRQIRQNVAFYRISQYNDTVDL